MARRGASGVRAHTVFHLHWDGLELFAWAERGVSDPLRTPPAAADGVPHPAALSAAEMGAALDIPPTRVRALGAVRRLPLPARGTGPDGAGPLRPVPPPGFGAPQDRPFPVAPFAVPGVVLPPESLVPVLLRSGPPRAGWRLGGDARFWRAAARLALARCARGSCAPGTGCTPGGAAVAVWAPAPDPEAEAAEAHLAALLPPACRLGAAEQAPAALVHTFVAAALDAAARAGLAERRQRWSRGLRADRPGMRRLLGLLHPVPLPLPPGEAPPPGAAGAPPRVRLVLRLDDPVPRGRGGDAAELRCPLTLWIQASGPGADQSLTPLPAAMLSPLGGAARVALRAGAAAWGPLGEVLRRPDTSCLWLSPGEALQLVDRGSAILARAGVEVRIPAWWHAAPARPAARLRIDDAGTGLSAAALADFRWEAALGGQAMELEAFERLAQEGARLVRLRDGWVRADPEALLEVAGAWARTGARGRVAGYAALRLALEAGAAEPRAAGAAAGDVAVEAAGGVDRWLRGLEEVRRARPLPEPPGFVGQLRPYQRAGLGWLAFLADLGLGGCLADDMGLGKTVQVLAVLAHRRAAGRPALLVCPTSVLWNWSAEAARFVPDLRVHIHHGAARSRGAELARRAAGVDLVATTYALLSRDREDLGAIAWDGVVLDEAQNVKNPDSQQAQAARALPAGYRIALTGTPIENGLGDLWSIFSFLLPGYLGSGESFRREYGRPVAAGDGGAAGRLRRAVAPFVLRRTKRDPGVAPELPEKLETRQDCGLVPEQAALYEGVVREGLASISAAEGLRRKAAVLTSLLRLKQVCDHPSLFLGDGGPLPGRSGKLGRLETLLEDVLGAGDRALIFTQFAAWAGRLAAHIAERTGHPAYCLTGSVPAAQRPALVRAFQEESGPAVFVLSLHAGGAGLNLTNAQHVFHFDRWWNPAVEAQATDRAYRIGQGRTVQVHTLVVRGTLEERIDALLERKRDLARAVVGGASEAWITELGTEELRALFALGPGALEG